MTEIELTPEQQEVIDVICSGGTVHGAIAIANVLRKDVLAWRRELPHFEAALQQDIRRLLPEQLPPWRGLKTRRHA